MAKKKETLIDLIVQRENINSYLLSEQFKKDIETKTKQIYTEERTAQIVNSAIAAILPILSGTTPEQ